ncbi:two-component system, chemotaxis family, CheB/CheR fusion protein [Mucilaginibacter lappiensis]|uniref:Two-component system CheB/CheR fusion protein n=1 Tax=Mucilaginibacter lappiensis TaxID=354630 RepID=A0ABR6PEM5_9SPHI|nr:chemotaxis protein CheB [Mucilaginibacter lappiensis]MBB6108227.1 two-component system CheB/CheR fusion protein [Mucilaginibacter lappiensis]SIQ46616.1 two-component system, chemotaxis family, CheB/CheR fusion protein [Mucilaginibacter lappiensis]
MPKVDPHHIIAIGASAGGMEEINSFFDHTPLDGVSYIIIQHLSADFKSRMVDLLARHSKLIVEEAEDGMKVQCNQVYLIPSNKYMTIRGGSLYLTEKEKIKGPHLTINTFFESLAANDGKKAIGIILSGLGSDGTEGIKAIKKAGGMVMARDPETSEFSSMPSHAIATGLVDFVLEPTLMPGAIEDYVKHEGNLVTDHRDDEKDLLAIIDLIKERSPLDFSDYKQPTILRRTKRRASSHNFNTLGKYLNYLKETPLEVDALAKEFLISVTSFFRDPAAFDFIQSKVLPDILEGLAPDEELKMWVAGCATGEEVYSLAILIAEQLTGRLSDTVVKLFATDIDSDALIHAGKGVYSKNISKNMPPERLEKYFLKEGENYRINPVIRKMVIFAKHDLVKNPPYCNMHLISCRNLLIYMAPVLQKKIFTMMLFGLKKDGYLFLGSSENPMPIIKNLEVVHKKWKIYKNLETKRAISFDAFSMPDLPDTKQTPSRFSPDTAKNTNHNNLSEEIHESLANKLDYLAVCIDEHNQVVRSYGDTTKYLLHKHFSSDLAELLPKPLAVAFNTLSKKVLKTNENVVLNGVKIKQGQHMVNVSLSISPLILKGREKLLWVTFSEDKSAAPVQKDAVYDERIYLDQYVVNLEEERKELKDKLYSSNEKLDASNENMQSFNEELISANEEMQSTNEEMQSVNEELHTINSDYQLKNKELLEINDDLNNYFRSNINGQLFIDNELRLMKFSPGTVKQINLLETDIGRPLSNISTNIKFETIIDDIKKVLAEGCVITKEIETNNGKWYQIMTMPYVQQADHTNNGAIITFNDITELKRIQQELDISSKTLGMAIDSAEMGIWSIDVETREFIPSPRLKELFGFHADEQMSYESTIAQIDSAFQLGVTGAIEAAITRGEVCDVEFPLKGFHDGKLRWVRANGNLTHDQDGKPGYFTGVMHDVTVHKQDDIRKTDFIAMASHELKTPLTTLQAYIQMLAAKADKSGDTFAVGALDKANVQVKKMSTLINGFLSASSFEAGKIYLNEQPFEMNTLLREIVEDIMLITKSHYIVVTSDCDIVVQADRDKIGQVITNFLSNAIKYSSKGKNIKVSCREIKGVVEVSITDEGLGIAPQDHAKLFDRYYRIESEQTQNISGFGLGLYLSAEIIQRHKGKVWVESEMGKGSTFYFSLPLA